MPNINPGYAQIQLAKALLASPPNEHRIHSWTEVLSNILARSAKYGSRAPLKDVPAWATLDVVTGGFATGALLAGGPLLPFEQNYLSSLPPVDEFNERLALNSHFLSDAGMAQLQEMLRNGCYEINIPEEGALLVAAWLAKHGHAEQARALIDEIIPFFAQLRFYPIPTSAPRRQGPRVHVHTTDQVIDKLHAIRPNRQILAQKEAVLVWAPFNDRVVALFSETYLDGWPCRNFTACWESRANGLLAEYAALRRKHQYCRKQDKPKLHYAKLRELLRKCVMAPASLTASDVGMIRLIVNKNIEKHGPVGDSKREMHRHRQAGDVAGAMHDKIALVVAARIARYPQGEGIDDTLQLKGSVLDSEATDSVPAGTRIPPSICHKAVRCQSDSIEGLIRANLITSGEVMAQVLPQLSSGLSALSIDEPSLRGLYAAIYRAFRRRRSLLLLNLEKQVGLEELPWVAAADRFRSNALSHKEVAKQALEETAALVVTAFPQTPVPNKLLQEFSALAKHAGIELPLTEELATDIFMGQFSGKFKDALGIAASLLDKTLYSRYYGIDYSIFRQADVPPAKPLRWFPRPRETSSFDLAAACANRAGVPYDTWRPSTNGMIIEQQQILTTQNLATLFARLQLGSSLRDDLPRLSKQCFRWICNRLQVQVNDWHSDVIRIKNAAYAWRQMIFFLSLQSESEIAEFMDWAHNHFEAQAPRFQVAFSPAWQGLNAAAQGTSLDQAAGARVFLGWSNRGHWLASGH
jgi:hypothetical protein